MTLASKIRRGTLFRILASVVVSGCCASVVVGCYDTEPVHVDRQPSPTLPPDATPCDKCIYSELEGVSTQCAPSQVGCANSGNCLDIMRCILQDGCFAGASFQRMVTCGTPCALALGAKSGDDPPVQAGLAIGQCMIGACTAECSAPAE